MSKKIQTTLKYTAFPRLTNQLNPNDFPDYPVEYLYWTDLNKTTPAKPVLNNFARELVNNREFVNCDHIDPYYVIDETYKFTPQNTQKYKYAEPGVRNHYYGGIVKACLNHSIAAGLHVPYIARAAHTCDLLVVAIEKREDTSIPYDPEEFKRRRIAGFTCINLIRKNIFEIDVIGTRTNHIGVGGALIKALCAHGKNVGLKYCWLNSVPNAVSFYLKMGFIYLGHTITSGIEKGYMLFELKNAEGGEHKKMIRIRDNMRNSTNISELIQKGNPNTKVVEARNITDEELDIIEDVNTYIDMLSKSQEAEIELEKYKRAIKLKDSRKVNGYYIQKGFYEKICPGSTRNPLFAAAEVNPLLDPGFEEATAKQNNRKTMKLQNRQSVRPQLTPRPPPGPPPSQRRAPPTSREASKFFKSPGAWASHVTGFTNRTKLARNNLSTRRNIRRSYPATPYRH